MDVQNVIEIQTFSDEQLVTSWLAERKISRDAIEKLLKDGFTSMEAVKLIESEDLVKSKIPRGQQKLIISEVQKLVRAENSDALSQTAHAQVSNEAGNGISQQKTAQAQLTESSATAEVNNQHGGQATSQLPNANDDVYIRAIMEQFNRGQADARSDNTQKTVRQSLLGNIGVSTATDVCNLTEKARELNPSNHSWRDPQIYLSAAASGKSAPSFHDITDFVTGMVEEEIIVGGSGSQQIVLKTGPKKIKLENVSLAQWSVANLGILYKLIEEGKLNSHNILDYLSYTTKVCQLVQRFNLVSVLLYDREYRKLQSVHDFRWGTDVPHLHSVHLQPRGPKPHMATSVKAQASNPTKPNSTPLTLDGKVICKLFNSKAGCHFKDCKYVHQCSVSGCYQSHSGVTHYQAKN